MGFPLLPIASCLPVEASPQGSWSRLWQGRVGSTAPCVRGFLGDGSVWLPALQCLVLHESTAASVLLSS